MIHLGDITKISGYDVPVVDCIIGGSPCQDLSVAGKRAGLTGERSGLFMEQIRIIKEMREQSERTTGIPRPRFSVWENVPGALSSNKGKDFRVVLEEFARIADKNAVIPRPPGKWTTAGAIVGNGWSVAWRVLDAQFWGVPQRRRRIALVADFGGQSAPEILFERKGVREDSDTGGRSREGVACGIESSAEKTKLHCLQGNVINGSSKQLGNGWREEPQYTLTATDRHGVCVPCYPYINNIVRYQTPLECERLQGYPDGWTDIGEYTDSKGRVRTTSDSARYKALGNSIALPPWRWLLERLCACYERDATMASLFDGIGGFPLIWEQLNGKGSCLWASEIEEFPMAVTKLRFGE